jgi:glycosyltransferase involved in cell wall biosynthesis
LTERPPVVSILCATRNRASTLARALRSIREQSFQDYEVLVLDDGSDEATFAQYDRLWHELDDRFTVHRIRPAGARGGGPSQARNHGIRLSQGQFIAFLDDDDWWIRPDHLSVAIDAMQSKGADYYFANMQGIRDDEILVRDWYPDSPQLTAGVIVNDAPRVYEVPLRAFLEVMQHHFVHPDNSIVRRELLLSVGGFFERVVFAEDYDLMMRIADRCQRILYRPDHVSMYRLPVADSISSTESRQDQTLQVLFCAQHVRLKSERSLVRRCARAREGWTLRELAKGLQDENRSLAALSYAWQAVCIYPTAGAAAFLLKSTLKAAMPGASSSRVRAANW